jgi:predicted AlkP superfamily pyrophosphatase or phosphodiesterase
VKILLAIALLLIPACASTPSGESSLEPSVLLVSLDGYRWDYATKYPTPALGAFRARSTRAEYLVPIFPTATFPNHYSIATGLYAEDHGIVGNEMFDPRTQSRFSLKDAASVNDSRWWGGEPIWVTAEKQGLRTATLFWVGSSAEIKSVRPKYFLPYDASLTPEARVKQVIQWLELPAADRPRFLTLYFEDVDSAGHRFGPDAPEVRAAIERVDAALGQLDRAIDAHGWRKKLNVMFVSDHGMAAVSPEKFIALAPFLGKDAIETSGYGSVAHFFGPKAALAALEKRLRHPHVKVWRKKDIPESLHYKNHPRIGELLAVADEGWYLVPPGGKQGPDQTKGAHGYLPETASMRGIFFASGPAFKENRDVGPVQNVSLYALMAKALGLKPAPTRAVASDVSALGELPE